MELEPSLSLEPVLLTITPSCLWGSYSILGTSLFLMFMIITLK